MNKVQKLWDILKIATNFPKSYVKFAEKLDKISHKKICQILLKTEWNFPKN